MDDASIRETLAQFWAPAAALVIASIVLVIVLRIVWRNSRRGRMTACAKERRKCLRMASDAAKKFAAARRRVEKLEARGDKVPPKQLDEARGSRADAERLFQIRSDQLKVAENHLRQIIAEEFPPARHTSLRKRYSLAENAQSQPFTFDGG